MLVLFATKGLESEAYLESLNRTTTERVFFLFFNCFLTLKVTLVLTKSILQGHHEFPPYNPETLRSVYHIRNIEVFRLKQVNIMY